tara:strand:+ start:314 stop:766 length:453 start_codon:yes stop_codon:yes gene_type:complete
MPVKSFKGILEDGGKTTISLHTNDGKTGYRIVKFQAIPEDPGSAIGEHMVKIFKTDPTAAPTSTVDFSDQTLLGCVSISTHSGNLLFNEVIIFDNEIFNQDIFVTHIDKAGGAKCNYYIELEQIDLDLVEQTVATLQSIRSSAQGTGQKS